MTQQPVHVPANANGTAEPREYVPAGRARKRLGLLFALLLLAIVFKSMASNPRFEWHVIGTYLFSETILQGLYLTLWVTAIVFLIAFLLGIPLALIRMSHVRLLATLGWAYVWVFRSIPLLVQLIFWYNLAVLYPRISIGAPFGAELSGLSEAIGGPTIPWEVYSTSSESLLTPMMAAIIGLSLHEAAYACEIVRGGLVSVETGQVEAAQSLGLSRRRIVLRIVLPQAMRSIVPGAGNHLIMCLKATSLISVISVADLLYSAQIIYNRTFQVVPLLIVATIWYMVVTAVLSVLQHYVEQHFNRGNRRNPSQPRATPDGVHAGMAPVSPDPASPGTSKVVNS